MTSLSPSEKAIKVDQIVRARLDAMMEWITSPSWGPHFGGQVCDLMKLTEASHEGIDLHEDGVQTVPSRTAKATVVIDLHVEQRCCNFSGNAHGGFVAWLVDMCSSMPLTLLAGPTMWQTAGVSANINVYYLAGIPLGTDIKVISTVIQKGKSTATMEARVVDAKTGKLYALGVHTKVDAPPKIHREIKANL